MSCPIALILKLTECCNYNCSFCGYPKNGSKQKMSLDTIEETVLKAARYNKACGYEGLHIIFHGGEPLIVGKDFFRRAFDCIEQLKEELGKNFRFTYAIQTNGYLLDEEWIMLFNKKNVDIGVSIDGPTDINEHKIDLESEKKVLMNIRTLNKNNSRFGIISVITNKHYNKEKEYYDFLIENGIRKVSYNLCFDSQGICTVNSSIAHSFLRKLFDLYFDGQEELSIRDFDITIDEIVNGEVSDYCCRCGRLNCGQYLTIDCDGRVFFCDIALDKQESLGNIHEIDFEQIVFGNKWKLKRDEAMKYYKTKCCVCEYRFICGGGCYRNDINGTNVFCEVYEKLYFHVREKVQEVLKNE